MTTEAQIEANRRNARSSTGPVTEEGKAASRLNATTHGLAGRGLARVDRDDPEYRRRREAMAAELRPVGESGSLALDRLVAATFRVEACESAFDRAMLDHRERAKHAWETDRRRDAGETLARLAVDPLRTVRRLESTRHGAELMIDVWGRLAAPLEAGRDWDDAQRSTALDLLGLLPHLRDGATPLEPPAVEGGAESVIDPIAHHKALVEEQVARLESFLEEGLAECDNLAFLNALSGMGGLLSRPVALILRYEREAHRQRREALAALMNTAAATPAPFQVSAPTPVRPEPRREPGSPSPSPTPARRPTASEKPGALPPSKPTPPLSPALRALMASVDAARGGPLPGVVSRRVPLLGEEVDLPIAPRFPD